MKRKTLLSKMLVTSLVVGTMAASLSGCGTKSEVTTTTTTKAVQSTTVELVTEKTEEIAPTTEATTTVKEEETTTTTTEVVEPVEVLNDESAAYAGFAKNEVPVYFDKANMEYNAGEKLMYEKETPYTLKEMVTNLMEMRQEDSLKAGKLKRISYTDIDCGEDGIPELLLEIDWEAPEEYGTHTEVFVIKLIDEKLQAVYCKGCFENESYVSIDDRGVVSTNFSNTIGEKGGEEWKNMWIYSDTGILDANGDYKFLYNEYSQYTNEFFQKSADELYEKGDTEVKLSNGNYYNIYTNRISAEDNYDVTKDVGNPDIYYTYSNYYIYLDSYYPEFPEESESEGVIKKIAENTGLTLITEDERYEKIEEILKEKGYSGEYNTSGYIPMDEYHGVDLDQWVDVGYAEKDPEVKKSKGHFVKVGDTVYFNVPETDALEEIAINGWFSDSMANGTTALMSYNEKTEELQTEGWGGYYGQVSISGHTIAGASSEEDYDGKLYTSEIRALDIQGHYAAGSYYDEIYIDSYGENTYFYYTDEDGRLFIKVLSDGEFEEAVELEYEGEVAFWGVENDLLIYTEAIPMSDSGECSYELKSFSAKDGAYVDYGTLPAFDDGWGEITQRLVQDGTLYLIYGNYEGNIGAYNGKSALVTAELNTPGSLKSENLETEYTVERDYYPPTFILEDGKAVLTEGEPYTADAIGDDLGYYNEKGEFVPVISGYGYYRDDETEAIRVVDVAEYVDGAIYAIVNDAVHVPEFDISIGEAYKRTNVQIIRVDIEKGEDSVIYSVVSGHEG